MGGSNSEARTRGDAGFFQPGSPTDETPPILATGSGDVTTAFLNFAARSATGQDAAHIHWHQFDHMPEQYRLPGLRNGQRWVSTPACRAARRAEAAPFDQLAHVVQYLFAEPAAENLKAFADLGAALKAVGRFPFAVAGIKGAHYDVVDRRVNPRGVLGADVLPWWPAAGIYLTIERTPQAEAARAAHDALSRLVALDGVAGAWRYRGAERKVHQQYTADPGETVTVFYLYADPVATAGPLGDLLERQWEAAGAQADFAGPFHVVRPAEWDRYLP